MCTDDGYKGEGVVRRDRNFQESHEGGVRETTTLNFDGFP